MKSALATLLLLVVLTEGCAAGGMRPDESRVDAGLISVYRDLVPVLVGSNQYWVIQDAGAFRAFANSDPRSKCTLRWLTSSESSQIFDRPEAARGVFRDTCDGSSYSPSGKRVFGPANDDLSPLPVLMSDGRVFIQVKKNNR
jgi:hypothetical protein